MAQFCTKCGTPLPEGMKFCLGCGAAIGQPVAPAAPGPLAPAPVAPMAPVPVSPIGEVSIAAGPAVAPAAPVAAAPSKSSPVLKIVLIVVALLIFFGVLSAGACVYVVYRAKQRVSQYEKQVRSSIAAQAHTGQPSTEPSAPASSGQTSAVVDTGIPVYPGAVALEGQNEVLGMAGFKLQQYTTSDSVDQVLAFYKDKLGPNAMVTQSGNQASVHVVGSNAVITIAITVDNATGKTKIAITSIGKQ